MNMTRLKLVSSILAVTAALASGQSVTKPPATPPSQKAAPKNTNTNDDWQKSKECAEQSEKVMKEKGEFYRFWRNHYSPKYNKCFIEDSTRVPGEGAGRDYPELTVELIDAFERTHLAQWVSETTKPAEPPRADGVAGPLQCHIGYQRVDCAKAIAFISEHMKN
jgi:hypothetical protein